MPRTVTKMGTRAYYRIDWMTWEASREGLKYFSRISEKSSNLERIERVYVTEGDKVNRALSKVNYADVIDMSTIETLETMRQLITEPVTEQEVEHATKEVVNNLLQTGG